MVQEPRSTFQFSINNGRKGLLLLPALWLPLMNRVLLDRRTKRRKRRRLRRRRRRRQRNSVRGRRKMRLRSHEQRSLRGWLVWNARGLETMEGRKQCLQIDRLATGKQPGGARSRVGVDDQRMITGSRDG